jgi:hypothetical protein
MAAARPDQIPLATRALFVEQVRQSAAVQEARADVLLEGAMLAAEQVQDVRIAVLEEPTEMTATEFWVEVALTVIIESNLASKLLAATTKKIFTPVVRSNALFLLLPKSAQGRELAAAGKVFEEVAGSGRSVLRDGIAKLPGTASKDSLKLYHAAIQQLVTASSQVDLAKTAVKVTNQVARAKNRPRANRPLAASDSAGVAVLHGALEYASATRLGIRFALAGLERAVWTATRFDDLAAVGVVVDWEDLTDPQERETFSQGLAVLRKETARFLEALIWGRMYGFADAQRQPGVTSNPAIGSDATAPFTGVKKPLQTYWRDRFQADADAYAVTLGQTVVPAPVADAVRLRTYFGAVSAAVNKAGLDLGRQALLPAP